MLNTKDIVELFDNDPHFVRKLALEYIDFGSFNIIEARMGIEANTLEPLFYEQPEYADRFDDILGTQADKKLRRESQHKIFKFIDDLNTIIEDESGTTGSQDRLRAATVLSQILQKSIHHKTDGKRQADKDELDKLYEEIQNESQTPDTSSKDM